MPSRPNVVGVAAVALVGSGFDYIENAFAWRVLATYPDVGASGTLLGFASAAKTISSWVAGVALLACLTVLAGRTIRRMVASPRRSYLAVVFAFAWPASRCTVSTSQQRATSTPAAGAAS